jgi:F0F1-type ATP synthase membrane subunit b/b'
MNNTGLTLQESGPAQYSRSDTLYQEAEEQARVLLESARADTARTMADMQATLAQELAQARQSLTASVPTFAHAIATKLLGRPLT